MKPKVFLRIVDETGNGDLQFEFDNLKDLKHVTEQAVTILLSRGKMVAEQMSLPFAVGGIPIQRSETFPCNMKLSECLTNLKERNQSFSGYTSRPGEGWTFNLV